MEAGSLGLIETWGIIPAIEAADAGSKAANVRFIGYDTVRAGLITVKFVGDVSAVATAVSAGAAAAARVGQVISKRVIARPGLQLLPASQTPLAAGTTPEITPPPISCGKAEESIANPSPLLCREEEEAGISVAEPATAQAPLPSNQFEEQKKAPKRRGKRKIHLTGSNA
jgi:hypothetical protein